MTKTSKQSSSIIRTPRDDLQHSIRKRIRAEARLADVRADVENSKRAALLLGFTSAYTLLALLAGLAWGFAQPGSHLIAALLGGVAAGAAVKAVNYLVVGTSRKELAEYLELHLVTLGRAVDDDIAAIMSPQANKKPSRKKRAQ